MTKILVTFFVTFSWTFCIAQTDTLKKEPIKVTKLERKRQFGIIIGVGTSKFKTSYSNWQQGSINYNDSLNGISVNRVFKLEFGFVYQVKLSKVLSIRPTYQTIFEGGKLNYQRKTSTETINLSTYSHTLSFPFVINHNFGNYRPYLSVGPTLLYMMAQKKDVYAILPITRFDILGETAVGVDFHSKVLKCIVSPGVKYSLGFLNNKGNANNIYGNTISELKRQSISFTINFRQG
jgi:hypothetical protein